MRLNKFLAKSGIASRRRSDELIKMAMVTVNNEIVLDPAYNAKESDKKQLKMAEKLLEELRNKAFGEPDDASRTYYQHGHNGFFRVVFDRSTYLSAINLDADSIEPFHDPEVVL